MTLQVLAVTMNQSDDSILKKMNIQSDVLVGNQCDRNCVETFSYEGYQVHWYSFAERGVGLNRNNLLMRADADIFLLADDDITYEDGYVAQVLRAFEELPDADAILFGLRITRNGEVYRTVEPPRLQRAHLWNSMRYGATCMAIRNQAIQKSNLCFSRLFGGGCIYSSGEDSLFIRDALKAGLKIYTYPYTLGNSAQDTSSWFTGYHRKFFYDKGAWLASAFPHTKNLMKFYFVWRFRKQTELTYGDMLKEINRGIKGYDSLNPYEEP